MGVEWIYHGTRWGTSTLCIPHRRGESNTDDDNTEVENLCQVGTSGFKSVASGECTQGAFERL